MSSSKRPERKPGEGSLAYASRVLEHRRLAPLELKNPKIVMDPPELAALRKEVQHHPEIAKELGSQMDDLPTTIGVLAAYVDLAMDGHYTFEDLMGACDAITARLYKKRTTVVYTGPIKGDPK